MSGIKAYGRAPARTHAPYTTAGSGDARRGGGPSTSAPRRSVPPAAAEQQGQQGQRELEPLLRQDPFLLPAQLQPGGPLAPFAVDGLLPPPGLGFSSSAPLNLASSGSLGSLASSGQLPSLAAAAQVNLSMLSGRELQQLLLRLQAAKAQRAAAAAAPAAAANPWLAPTPDEAGPALKAEPADPLAALLLPPPPPPPQRPAEAAGGGLEGGGAGRGSPDPPSSSFLAAASVPFVSQGAEHPPPITCQPPSQPQLQQPAPQQPGQALHWQLQSLLSSQSLPPTPLPPGGDMPLDHWDLRGVAGSAMESGPARVGSWESQPSRTSRLPSLAAQGSVSQPAPCGAGFDVKVGTKRAERGRLSRALPTLAAGRGRPRKLPLLRLRPGAWCTHAVRAAHPPLAPSPRASCRGRWSA